MIKRVLTGLVLLLAALAAAVVGNTLRRGSRQLPVPPLATIDIDVHGLRFSWRGGDASARPIALLAPQDLARVHGTDERIAVEPVADRVRFYHRRLSQSAS